MIEYRVVELKTSEGKEWYVQQRSDPRMGWEDYWGGWVKFYSKRSAIRKAKKLKKSSEYQKTTKVAWP